MLGLDWLTIGGLEGGVVLGSDWDHWTVRRWSGVGLTLVDHWRIRKRSGVGL